MIISAIFCPPLRPFMRPSLKPMPVACAEAFVGLNTRTSHPPLNPTFFANVGQPSCQAKPSTAPL